MSEFKFGDREDAVLRERMEVVRSVLEGSGFPLDDLSAIALVGYGAALLVANGHPPSEVLNAARAMIAQDLPN